MSKLLIYRSTSCLDGQSQSTNIKVALKDDTLVITAYNKKLRITVDELIIHLEQIEISEILTQILNNLKTKYNNVVYNLKECFKYINEFIVFTDNRLQLKQQAKLVDVQRSAVQIQQFFKQHSKPTEQSQIFGRCVVKFGANNYGTLYQKQDVMFLKCHQPKFTTNSLKIHNALISRLKTINQQTFELLFEVNETSLNYSETAQIIIQNSELKQQQIIIPYKVQIAKATMIQKSIRRYLLIRQIQVRRYKNNLNALITRALLIDGNAYKLRLLLKLEQSGDQMIIITATSIEHTFSIDIRPFKQKLFLQYSISDIMTGALIMISQIHIIKVRNQHRLSTILFEQAFGSSQGYNRESNSRDQSIEQRIQLYKQSLQKQSCYEYPIFHVDAIDQNIVSKQSTELNQDQLYHIRLIQRWIRRTKIRTNRINYRYDYGLNYMGQSDYCEYKVKCLEYIEEQNQQVEQQSHDIIVDLGYDYIKANKLKYTLIINREILNIGLTRNRQIVNIQIQLSQFNSQYLLTIVEWKQDRMIKFFKPLIKQLSILICSQSKDEINSLTSEQLRTALVSAYIVKVQCRVRSNQLKAKQYEYSHRLKILLRISIIYTQQSYYRIIFRVDNTNIIIRNCKWTYELDLQKLRKYPIAACNYSEFQRYDSFEELLAMDAGYKFNAEEIRSQYNPLINYISTKLQIYNKDGKLKFNCTFPIIERCNLTQIVQRTPNNRKLAALLLIQNFCKRCYYRKLLSLRKYNKTYKYRTYKKLQEQYYIIYADKQNNDIIFTIRTNEIRSKCIKVYYQLRSDKLLNIGSIGIYQFLINKMIMVDGVVQFELQDFTRLQVRPHLRVNRKVIQSNLIDMRQEGNTLFNVVYSKQRLSRTIDCIKVDVSVAKARRLYPSLSQCKNRDIVNVLGSNLIKSVQCNTEQDLMIDQSTILASKVRLSNKPAQFRLARTVLKRKPVVEILMKTTQRFGKIKYLLQISQCQYQIDKIIPDDMDLVFKQYEVGIKIQSINLLNNEIINWELTMDQAIELSQQQDKQMIVNTLYDRLQILNQRYLYLLYKVTQQQHDCVMFVQEKHVLMMQRYLKNRKFIQNYQSYKSTLKQCPKHLYYSVDTLRSKQQFICICMEDMNTNKLLMIAWSLQDFQQYAAELPKGNYIGYWIKDKQKCVQCIVHYIQYRNEKLYYKKPSQDRFKQYYESH